MPFNPSATGTENSRLLDAKVVLPEGTSLNPSVANGLETCSDAQFGKGTDNPIQCPAGSKIGTVDVKPQALDQPLEGDVYVGEAAEPESDLRRNVPDLHPRVQYTVWRQRPPGRERYPEPEHRSADCGRRQKPAAAVRTNSSINIDGGPHGALTSPYTCGPHHDDRGLHTVGDAGSREQDGAVRVRTDQRLPAAGPVRKPSPSVRSTRATTPGRRTRKRAPTARSSCTSRGRTAQQEFRKIDVTLPPGMSAKLAGVDYCPEANDRGGGDKIRQRRARRIRAARRQPRRRRDDQGRLGRGPVHRRPGKAYFAGPYKGAPVSLVFIIAGGRRAV